MSFKIVEHMHEGDEDSMVIVHEDSCDCVNKHNHDMVSADGFKEAMRMGREIAEKNKAELAVGACAMESAT